MHDVSNKLFLLFGLILFSNYIGAAVEKENEESAFDQRLLYPEINFERINSQQMFYLQVCLIDACKSGDFETTRYLSAIVADIDFRSPTNRLTALEAAVICYKRHRNLELIEVLLIHKPNPFGGFEKLIDIANRRGKDVEQLIQKYIISCEEEYCFNNSLIV